MSDFLLKNQDLADSFRQLPINSENLIYIRDCDRLTRQDHARGFFPIDEESFRSLFLEIYEFMKAHSKKSITMSTVDDVIAQIKLGCTTVLENTNSPYIALLDGQLLNCSTFNLTPFTPLKRAFFALPITSGQLTDYSVTRARAESPKWHAFLDQIIIDKASGAPDTDAQTLLQEILGFCLLPSTRAEKSFFFVGDGANGKSVILSVLLAMMGQDNCSAYSIETLTTDKFATANLTAKRLNICTEEESHFLKSDKFKSLVSGERQNVRTLYARAREVTLNTKFIFATNEMPTFSGFNLGLIRRCIILLFNYTVPEKERNPYLAEELVKEELPTILSWALAGAKRLVENKFVFSESDNAKSGSELFQTLLSGTVSFIQENFVEDSESFISYDNLYMEYQTWCKDQGRKVQNQTNFKKDLRRLCKIEAIAKWDAEKGHPTRGRCLRPYSHDEKANKE